MSHSGEPISVVEDLDPDPAPGGSSGRQLWEFVLGLLVLLGVVGFAGWQWLHQSQQQSAYTAGTQAIARNDWDTARSEFGAASGYRDADRQAEASATKIARRAEQYANALASEKEGAWAACLQSIQQVSAIEPGYKDSARIEQEASDQVYRDAMSGTIALRPNASPPGLYSYRANGWAWLPRSDAASRIQGQSPAGRLVYDVPDREGFVVPNHPPIPYPPGSPTLTGRRLMVSSQSGVVRATELFLDPAPFSTFHVGDDGLWALRNDDRGSSSASPLFLGSTALNAAASLYISYASPLTSTMKLPRTVAEPFNRSTIMAFDSSGRHYLMARTQPDSLDSSVLITIFYLGEAGGDLRTIYTWKPSGGGTYSAQFSPDGRFALINGYLPWEQSSRFEEAQLIDLEGSTAPRLLTPTTVERAGKLPPNAPIDNNWLSTAFFSDGPYNGKVLIAAFDGKQHHLRVLDPEQQGEWKPLVAVDVSGSNPIVWRVHGGDDVSLLSGQETIPRNYPLVEVPLSFVTLSSTKGSTTTTLTTSLAQNNLDYARLVGDTLTYSLHEGDQIGASMKARSIYAFPISRLGTDGETAWPVLTQVAPTAGGTYIFSSGDYSVGPSLIAYLADNNLHARTYDSKVDVVLEQDATYLYNPSFHSTAGDRLR